ncbi:MAG: hypothetical protein MZV70_49190, partial [Desulfobacterales bacterium]|nr:hypothetical protein [Desulfobacterales bacterium]
MPSRRPASTLTSRPRPGPRLAEVAKKLVAAGACPGRVLIRLERLDPSRKPERLAQRALRDQGQRLRRPGRALHLQQPAAREAHPATGRLAEGQDLRLRRPDQSSATPSSTSGEVAMYTEPPRPGTPGSRRPASSSFGTAMLPYWPDQKGAPQNTIIGGASLWVLQGSQAGGVQRRGRLLQLPLHARGAWPTGTRPPGYLPITLAAYELTKKQGFYEKNPGTETATQADDPAQADRELQGHPLRRPRQDPRHHGQRVRGHFRGQEDGQAGPGRRRQGRQRTAAEIRKGQQIATLDRFLTPVGAACRRSSQSI